MAKPPQAPKPLNLKGSAGNDTLQGGALGDTIDGAKGNDILIGAGGDDQLTGGIGADTFRYLAFSDSRASTGIDRIVDFGAGDIADLTALGHSTLQSSFNASFSGLQAVLSFNAATNTTTLSYYQGSSTPVFQLNMTGNVTYSPTAFMGIHLPPTFAISDASATAEGGGLYFFVTRSGDLSQSGSVSYTVNGADAGSVSFAAGIADAVIIVASPEDSVAEPNELFTVQLTTNTFGGTYTDATGVGTIVDNDWPTEGNDNLVGTTGNDTIDLLGGNDIYDGLAGADTVNGGAGNDTIIGGAGEDTIIFSPGSDSFDGGDDYDTVDFSGLNPANGGVGTFASIGNYFVLGQSSADYLMFRNVEKVIGSAGNDTIDLSTLATNIAIHGGLGNDQITGGSGHDAIWGGDGNDVISGGGGSDAVNGERGEDTLVFTSGQDNFDGGDDYDTIDFSGLNPANGGVGTFASIGNYFVLGQSSADYLMFRNVEKVIGSAGNDTIDLSTLATNIAIHGGLGNDQITGGTRSDTLNGGEGNDLIIASSGIDTISGGAGFDTLDFSGYPSSGVLRVYFTPQNGGTIQFGNLGTFTGIEQVVGSAFNDDIQLSSDESVSIDGGAGNDTVAGGSANDHLVGGTGNDLIMGSWGDDELIGGEGDDILDGMRGADTLTGGLGADKFDMSNYTDLSGDIITDFSSVQGDKLEVSRLTSNNLGESSWYFSDSYRSDLASSGKGQLVLTANGDGTYGLTGYRAGDAVADFVMTLNTSVSASDFLGDVVAAPPPGPTEGNDNLIGTAGNDTIDLLAGNDTYSGLAGNDTIDGGSGNDTLDGGDGNDTIYGSAGEDTLHGGAGDDTLWSKRDTGSDFDATGNEASTMYGGDGRDIFLGSNGNDAMYGEGGDDYFLSAGGNDTLDGGSGNDTFSIVGTFARYNGVLGTAVIHGGSGSDAVVFGEYGTANNGGPGINIEDGVAYDAATGFIVATFDGIDSITGTNGDDVIDFSTSTTNLVLIALRGNDTLIGGHGNDSINGDAGGNGHATAVASGNYSDYTITPQTGYLSLTLTDSRVGGDGNDTLYAVATVRFADGIYDVGTSVFTPDVPPVISIANQTVTEGGTFTFTLTRTGDLSGTSTVSANIANVTTSGSDGNWPSVAHFGFAAGSATSGIATFTTADDSLVESNETLTLTLVNPVNGTIGDGVATGTILDNDAPVGAIVGTTGDDTLTGTVGNDTFYGLQGNDIIYGGIGGDSLYGGAGNDVFVYNSVSETSPSLGPVDEINDFVRGSDLIDLSEIDANTLTPIDDAFTFIGTDPFNGTAGQLRAAPYPFDPQLTGVQGDVDGDGLADFQIEVVDFSTTDLDGFHYLIG